MDATGRRLPGLTPIATRRQALSFLVAGLLAGRSGFAHGKRTPARISLIYDFSAARSTEIVTAIRAGFAEDAELSGVRIRDVDVALIDAAMAGDAQRETNLVIGIGRTVAAAIAARPSLFADGHCWIADLNEPFEFGARQVGQYLLRRDYDLYLKQLKKLLPTCRRIGVLHDAHANPEVARLRSAVEALGLQHVCIELSTPNEIEPGVRHIAQQADVLFGVDCTHIYNEMTARGILRESFAQQLPMIGLDASWVNAGALLSMDWDSGVLGEQISAWALADWRRPQREQLVTDTPNTAAATFLVNVQVAKRFGIEGIEGIEGDSAVVHLD